jgi:hypothetical protein
MSTQLRDYHRLLNHLGMLQDEGLLPTAELPRVEAMLKRIAANWIDTPNDPWGRDRAWKGYRHARIWCRLVRRNMLNRGILRIGEEPTGYELCLN